MASEAVQATLGARLQAERRVLEEQARRRPPPPPAGRRLRAARAALAPRVQAEWRMLAAVSPCVKGKNEGGVRGMRLEAVLLPVS